MALTIQEHRELFEAIRRKLPDAAEAASRRMIERTAQRAYADMNRSDGKSPTPSPLTELDS
jgi:DNA-binding FadR family transcriptional regulator